ncbi:MULTISPECIES: S8 family peptidase [unclassified Pseudoalteromonas]|uniref:S8 family peptidase n=1 Tax=unclassified Pseudoalteromonas TaxID=194690 RepID=UPI001891BD4B|nr:MULTISPECIES: S8 family peptidase [unclassified Pseudoalteromonas]MCG7563791.1 S8 family serine peptidase [Pseudoalteromonas sp. McH1-42]
MIRTKLTILAACIAATHSLAVSANDYPLMPGDPLVSHQWHLQNTGQAAFSDRGGKAGEDMNLSLTHALGILGTGVTAAVIDGAVELTHPDLRDNVRPGSWNFTTDTPDLVPGGPTDRHGTSVAGIIAASAFNGIGGRGIAPRAGIVGFNLISSGNYNTANWLQSHGMYSDGYNKHSFDFPRIFNQSYGRTMSAPDSFDYTVDPWLKTYEDAQEEITRTTHGGRGALFVKSAGNGYARQTFTDPRFGSGYLRFENNNHGLPLQNVNLEQMDTSFWNMVVSAYNADGQLSSYSTVGSAVFVSATGGQYGVYTPAMVTTDLTGCDAGYNPAYGRNDLHGGHPLDPNCDYGARFNGTSSAAPSAAGAIALIMSANPALSWQDVRHILASTARQIDPDNAGVALSFETAQGDTVSYQAIDAWQTNAAGYAFHNFYGFGAVDVDAAVNMARFYDQQLGQFTQTERFAVTANSAIPDGDINGVSSTYQSTEVMTVDAIQVRVNIDHTSTRDLAIELISPSGTRSVIMTPRTGTILGQNGMENTQMLTHHFYGEQAQGEWTLRVIDTAAQDEFYVFDPRAAGAPNVNMVHRNNSDNGLLKSWDIRFIGRK